MNKHYIIGDGQFALLLKHLFIDENIAQADEIFFVTKKKIKKKNYISENDFLLIKERVTVFIGVGSVLVGDIVLGDNVTIGALTLVIKNFKSNSTIIGIPARLLK